MRKYILAAFMAGFIGGLAGALVMTSPQVQAALVNADYSRLGIFNSMNKRIAVLGSGGAGQGSLWLFDARERAVIQMGSYEYGAEEGQAMMGLVDRRNDLRSIWRLYGPNNAPALILKDNAGQDRLVIGVRSSDQTAYIEYIDEEGNVRNLIK